MRSRKVRNFTAFKALCLALCIALGLGLQAGHHDSGTSLTKARMISYGTG
ncbi:hypothetical protein [Mameliella sp.]